MPRNDRFRASHHDFETWPALRHLPKTRKKHNGELSMLALIVIAFLQSASAPDRGASGSGQELATLKEQAEAGDVKARVNLVRLAGLKVHKMIKFQAAINCT
jgi:hypothetical protein